MHWNGSKHLMDMKWPRKHPSTTSEPFPLDIHSKFLIFIPCVVFKISPKFLIDSASPETIVALILCLLPEGDGDCIAKSVFKTWSIGYKSKQLKCQKTFIFHFSRRVQWSEKVKIVNSTINIQLNYIVLCVCAVYLAADWGINNKEENNSVCFVHPVYIYEQ